MKPAPLLSYVYFGFLKPSLGHQEEPVRSDHKVVMNRARSIMDCIHSGPPSNDKKAITMPATIASATSTVTTIFALFSD